jgi:hypothetical protein
MDEFEEQACVADIELVDCTPTEGQKFEVKLESRMRCEGDAMGDGCGDSSGISALRKHRRRRLFSAPYIPARNAVRNQCARAPSTCFLASSSSNVNAKVTNSNLQVFTTPQSSQFITLAAAHNASQVTHPPARPATSWLRTTSSQTRNHHHIKTSRKVNIVEAGELSNCARSSRRCVE